LLGTSYNHFSTENSTTASCNLPPTKISAGCGLDYIILYSRAIRIWLFISQTWFL